MQFVERHVADGQEVVILRYAAIFYWLMWPTLIISIVAGILSSSTAAMAAAAVAWAMLLAIALPYWPVLIELRRRMRESAITASGSKYSLSNPLTYRWPVEKTSVSDSV
jgi:hypothetical protein